MGCFVVPLHTSYFLVHLDIKYGLLENLEFSGKLWLCKDCYRQKFVTAERGGTFKDFSEADKKERRGERDLIFIA